MYKGRNDWSRWWFQAAALSQTNLIRPRQSCTSQRNVDIVSGITPGLSRAAIKAVTLEEE